MKKITEKEADEWVRKNKHRHKWVTAKMLSYFANDKIKELNQNKDDYSFERVSTEERQRERSDKYDYLIGDDDDIKLNQNKPLPPPPPKDREIHISGKSRHKR